jgi:hypothetical protein
LVFFSILAIRPRVDGVHIPSLNHGRKTLSTSFQTDSNFVTIGQTDFQATCKTTLMVHKGNQPLGSLAWAYTVEQTDAGQIIVTVTGLLGMSQ